MESILKSLSLGFLLRSLFAGVFFVISFCIASPEWILIKVLELSILKNILSFKLPLTSFFLSTALIAGVIVYALHRSIVYPWLEDFFNMQASKNARKGIPLISKTSIENIITRWQARAKWESKENWEKVTDAPLSQSMEHITTWADYTHLLYVSSLSIFLGTISSYMVSNYSIYEPLGSLALKYFILVVMFIFLGVATKWKLTASLPLPFFFGSFAFISFAITYVMNPFTIYPPLTCLALIFFFAAFISDWRLQCIKDYIETEEKYGYYIKILSDQIREMNIMYLKSKFEYPPITPIINKFLSLTSCDK